jgi:8-amino-7-oxononanoate synthase
VVDLEGRRLLDLSSNDYLGLAGDLGALTSFLRDPGAATIDERGMSGSASRLLTGNGPAYEALESELGALYGGRAALVFSSGYHANLGLLTALCGRGDLCLSDRLNHASIIDGLRLSGAEFRRYRHRDCGHLEELLAAARGRYRRLFIVTESVFSMDGDLADLGRLVQLKTEYGALLIVDEAHGVGVFGERGLGLCEARGVLGQIDVVVGTFGKALASAGAFVVTDDLLREYCVNTARPLIFTTALPPAVLAWSLLTVRRMTDMRRERAQLAELAARLRASLREGGCACGGESQIVPILAGDNESAARLADRLQDAGYLAFPIRPPTVPPGTARVRLSLTAAMRWEQLAAIPAAAAAGGG